jgi:hypothetical protein
MNELGYALARVGRDRVVMVLNLAYGKPDELPFDLRHMRVMTYTAKPDETDRSASRGQLVKALADAIAAARPQEPAVTQDVDGERREFEAAVRAGKFHGMKPAKTQPMVGMLLLPGRPTRISLDEAVGNRRDLLRCIDAHGEGPKFAGKSIITTSPEDQPGLMRAVAELADRAVIRSATTGILRPLAQEDFARDHLPRGAVGYIPGSRYEELTCRSAHRYLELLRSLGVNSAILVGLSLWNVREYGMYYRSPWFNYGPIRTFPGDNIDADPIPVAAGDDVSSPSAVAKLLRPAFDYIWREFGFSRSMNFNESGDWVG